MSLRAFAKDSVIYGLGYFLVRAVSFLLLPVYTNALSKSEMGHVVLAFSLIAMAQMIYNMGMDAAFLKFFNPDESNQKSVFSTSFAALFLSSAVFSALLLLLANPVSQLFFSEGHSNWIVLIAGILFLDSFIARSYLYLRIRKFVRFYLFATLFSVLLTMVLNILFVLHFQWSVTGVLLGTIIASTSTVFILIPVLLRNFSFRAFDRTMLRQQFLFALPFLPASFFYFVLDSGDRFMLNWLGDVETVGVYGVAYKIGNTLLLLINAFNLAWQPYFIRQAKAPDAAKNFGKIAQSFILLTLFLGMTVSLLLPHILQIEYRGAHLIGSEFLGITHIVPVILLSYVLYSAYVLQMPALYLLEKNRWSPVFRGSAAVLNIGLNFYAIPRYGAMGAAVATLISYGFMTGFITYKNAGWMPLQIPVKKIFLIFLFAVPIFFCVNIFEESLLLSAIILLIFGIATFFALPSGILRALQRKFL